MSLMLSGSNYSFSETSKSCCCCGSGCYWWRWQRLLYRDFRKVASMWQSYNHSANFLLAATTFQLCEWTTFGGRRGGVSVSVAVSQCVQTQQRANECGGGCQNHFHNGRISCRSPSHVNLSRKLSLVGGEVRIPAFIGEVSWGRLWFQLHTVCG